MWSQEKLEIKINGLQNKYLGVMLYMIILCMAIQKKRASHSGECTLLVAYFGIDMKTISKLSNKDTNLTGYSVIKNVRTPNVNKEK